LLPAQLHNPAAFVKFNIIPSQDFPCSNRPDQAGSGRQAHW
jgi:hypothetical protein